MYNHNDNNETSRMILYVVWTIVGMIVILNLAVFDFITLMAGIEIVR